MATAAQLRSLGRPDLAKKMEAAKKRVDQLKSAPKEVVAKTTIGPVRDKPTTQPSPDLNNRPKTTPTTTSAGSLTGGDGAPRAIKEPDMFIPTPRVRFPDTGPTSSDSLRRPAGPNPNPNARRHASPNARFNRGAGSPAGKSWAEGLRAAAAAARAKYEADNPKPARKTTT
jgi:hypothetical protein